MSVASLVRKSSRLVRPFELRPTTALPASSFFRTRIPPAWNACRREYSASAAEPVEPPEFLSEGEKKIFDMLKDGLEPTKLEVQDVSGGCGSMYALDIVSEKFKGLPIIKQHRLVNSVLGDEIKKWHGVQMKTKAP